MAKPIPADPVVDNAPATIKVKLLAHFPINGKFLLFCPDDVKSVWAASPSDVAFVVGEQDVIHASLSPIFVPDDVANNIDAVRNYVLP